MSKNSKIISVDDLKNLHNSTIKSINDTIHAENSNKKSRALIKDINYHIENVWSLSEYINFINKDGECIVSDLNHWKEYNITTPSQLADYLDAACERNIEKSSYYD